MRQACLALLVVLLAACSTSSDRHAYQEEPLPLISLGTLEGQEVAIDLRDHADLEVPRGRLYDDLERELTRAGVRVVDQSPLQLRIKSTLITEDWRTARWQACGRLEGQLLRDGKAEGRSFISDYCNEHLGNPWRYSTTIRSEEDRQEARARAYHGLLRVFLNDLEQAVAAKG
ncbi:MAG TPA: hypothetical protein VEK57_18920 [Thermoanaerobaculia bacterium]|nr:hypothetical protein [Thermoanaerobaculia bacterium]